MTDIVTATAPENPPVTLADVLALHPLLPLAWRAARDAGAFLQEQRPADLVIDTKSTATDAVTMMDRGAEERIVSLVRAERPDDAFLGEEGGERAGTTGFRWVVDPLDGTVNYLYGLPMWGVSVAVEHDGAGAVGVVIAPDLGEAYVGVRGAGSWLVRGASVERLRVRDCAGASLAMVVTGFGYARDRRVRQAQVVERVIGEVRDLRRLGAAVVDLCWLARGRIDAFYEAGLNRWDLAAAELIAAEAGAVVDGLVEPSTAKFILAAVPQVADDLRRLLVASGAHEV